MEALGGFAFVVLVGFLSAVATACWAWFQEYAIFVGIVAATLAAAVKVGEKFLDEDDAKWEDWTSLASSAAGVLAFASLISAAIAP